MTAYSGHGSIIWAKSVYHIIAMDNRLTPQARKAVLTKFRRRRQTLYQKLRDLHDDCGAELSLTIRHRGRLYSFRASKDETFPPSLLGLVSKPNKF